MDLGKRIKQAISEINPLICYSADNCVNHRWVSDPDPAHRAYGLLRVAVNISQLCVHGEDIHQIHSVGASQEGFVRLQDEITVLQACKAGGWQVKFV